MKKYEIKIEIANKDYVDSLIVALVRQGYNVYLNKEDKVVCFTMMEEDMEEINE